MGSMIITTGLYAWVRSFSDMYSSIAEGFLSYFLRHSISEIGYFVQILFSTLASSNYWLEVFNLVISKSWLCDKFLMMFKWILSAVNRFSLTEWTKPNVVLHTWSPRYIYGDGRSFLSLHWLLTVINCSNWPNITKSSCSLVSSLRLNTLSSNSSNVGCFTLIVTQQYNVGYGWSTSLCP